MQLFVKKFTKNGLKIGFFVVALCLMLALALPVLAVTGQGGDTGQGDTSGQGNDTGSGGDTGQNEGGKASIISLEDPLNVKTDATGPLSNIAIVQEIILRLAKFLIAPIGAIAFLCLVIGGFYMIFSGGNEERVKQGKDIIVWTVVGIIVIFSAYAVINFVLTAVRG
ncbi:hypothetical protein HY933_04655 [Candidatus Falkowbacteria bacterium]|nr:hypothetical protein [Candidatus Falkowbacteria bacterium]